MCMYVYTNVHVDTRGRVHTDTYVWVGQVSPFRKRHQETHTTLQSPPLLLLLVWSGQKMIFTSVCTRVKMTMWQQRNEVCVKEICPSHGLLRLHRVPCFWSPGRGRDAFRLWGRTSPWRLTRTGVVVPSFDPDRSIFDESPDLTGFVETVGH